MKISRDAEVTGQLPGVRDTTCTYVRFFHLDSIIESCIWRSSMQRYIVGYGEQPIAHSDLLSDCTIEPISYDVNSQSRRRKRKRTRSVSKFDVNRISSSDLDEILFEHNRHLLEMPPDARKDSRSHNFKFLRKLRRYHYRARNTKRVCRSPILRQRKKNFHFVNRRRIRPQSNETFVDWSELRPLFCELDDTRDKLLHKLRRYRYLVQRMRQPQYNPSLRGQVKRNLRRNTKARLPDEAKTRPRPIDKPISSDDVLPQSDEENIILSEDEIPEYIEERNEMARAAIEAQPQKPDMSDAKLVSLLQSIDDMDIGEELKNSEEIDEWLGHLENLVILGYNISKANSYMDAFVAVAGYIKCYNKKRSLCMELFRLINEMSKTAREEVEPHSWKEWSGRDLMNNWDILKTNTIFKKISYLMSAAMSLTVCTTKKVEWSPFGLRLICVEAAKEQLKAVDVIDAIIKTFVWTAEVGWKCFETKSFAPILYSDPKIAEYNEDCDYVIAHADSAVAGNLDDLGAFEKKLNAAFKKTVIMKGAKTDGPTGIWLQKRYSDLVLIMEKLAAKRKNTDLRFQPFGISLYGNTGVGKSTLGKLTMIQTLAAMGFCDVNCVVDESRVLTKDMFDKYDSTWTSDVLGVFMDDINNTKAEFSEVSHTAILIKFFNNVAAQAIKAELNAKGVVFIDFKVGILTTNTKELGAKQFSNCPESILRRFYHVEVVVKEKFRIPGSLSLNKKHPEIKASKTLVHDVWDLKIEEVKTYEFGQGITAYRFVPLDVVLDDGRIINTTKIGLKDYLDVFIQLSKEHKEEQDLLLDKSKKAAITKFCPHCKRFPEYCECVEEKEVEPHSAEMLTDIATNAVRQAIEGYVRSWTRPVDLINWCMGFSPIKKMTTNRLAKELQHEINVTATPLLVALTPTWLYNTRVFQRSLLWWQSGAAYYDIRRPLRLSYMAGLSMLGYGLLRRNKIIGMSGVASMWSTSVLGYFWHRLRLAQIQREYEGKRNALPEYFKNLRDGSVPQGVLLIGTLVLTVKLVKLWNDNRLSTQPHALTPESVDKQTSWFGQFMRKLGWKTETSVKGATMDHVLSTCKKNIGVCHFTRSDGSTCWCNIVYPQKGFVWFPYHIFFPEADMSKRPVEWVSGEVFRSENKRTSKFRFVAELGKNTVQFDGIDLVETFVESCPDISNNMFKFLPLKPVEGISVCTLMGRHQDVTLYTEKVTVDHHMAGHKYMKMMGGTYTTTYAENGSCMSMLSTMGKSPVIAGFHIGGIYDRYYGVMMAVTQDMARQTRRKMFALEGIRGMAEATELPKEQYGQPLIVSEDIHPHAKAIHALDKSFLDVFGSTKMRAKVKSKVIASPLANDAQEIFSFPNRWGKPQLDPNWQAYNATLVHLANPSLPFRYSQILRAKRDYVPLLASLIRKSKEDIRPLTDREAVNGRDGVRFEDGLKMKTSRGFPNYGPKDQSFYFVPEGHYGYWVMKEETQKEFDRCMDCWKEGKRAYPVNAATLKDEPTELGSSKVRVFQAVPIALSLAIRKYYLPILRQISLHPLEAECAVGINPFSHQWEDMTQHAERFAEDKRVIAWDYSKFDVRMSGQMTYHAWEVLIQLAEATGNYDPEDIAIMTNMLPDIIHPLLDWNGTLLMSCNMNSSGHNATVYINSIVNSLYVRMGFFHVCPEEKDFRSCVSAITYGDDFKGSVRSDLRERFNFNTFRDFMASHDIKITEPDKKEGSHDDLDSDDADFLKRRSRFIPEINREIGALDHNSMLKQLFVNLKSKEQTPDVVALSCVESYMHELFAHGREFYNSQQRKMKELCVRVFDYIPPAVAFSFDDRVDDWKKKYAFE